MSKLLQAKARESKPSLPTYLSNCMVRRRYLQAVYIHALVLMAVNPKP